MEVPRSEIFAVRGAGDQHLTLAGWLRPHPVPARGLEVSGQGSGRDVSPHSSGDPPPATLLWGESRQPLLLFRDSAECWTRWHEAFCLGFDRMRQGPKSAGHPGPPVMRSGFSPGCLPASQSQTLCHIQHRRTDCCVCFPTPPKDGAHATRYHGREDPSSFCTKAEAWSGPESMTKWAQQPVLLGVFSIAS